MKPTHVERAPAPELSRAELEHSEQLRTLVEQDLADGKLSRAEMQSLQSLMDLLGNSFQNRWKPLCSLTFKDFAAKWLKRLPGEAFKDFGVYYPTTLIYADRHITVAELARLRETLRQILGDAALECGWH